MPHESFQALLGVFQRSDRYVMTEVLRARDLLKRDWGIDAGVCSVTSYVELQREGLECERQARLHPCSASIFPFATQVLSQANGPVIAASDYVRALPELIRAFVPHRYVTLGTDGFGRSDTRAALRALFEVDAASIVIAALKALADDQVVEPDCVEEALVRYERDVNAVSSWTR